MYFKDHIIYQGGTWRNPKHQVDRVIGITFFADAYHGMVADP